MQWDKPLPSWVGWITRSIGWMIAAAIIVTIASGYGRFKLAGEVSPCLQKQTTRSSALDRTQQVAACLDGQAGPLEWMLLRPTRNIIAALPNAPCPYLGSWTATRGSTVYRVVLTDDSRFVAKPYLNAPYGSQIVTGSWGVVGKSMVWLYDEGHLWPPDVNPVTNHTDDAFALTEENGSLTHYARMDSGEVMRCPR